MQITINRHRSGSKSRALMRGYISQALWNELGDCRRVIFSRDPWTGAISFAPTDIDTYSHKNSAAVTNWHCIYFPETFEIEPGVYEVDFINERFEII